MSIRHNTITHKMNMLRNGSRGAGRTRRPVKSGRSGRAGRSGRPGRRLLLPVAILMVCIFGVGIMAIHYYTAETYMLLNGAEQLTVGKHGLYEDPGVTAKWAGRDVSDKVEVSGKVNTKKPGDYVITYKSGNFSAERTVTVLDHMVPKLKLKGDKNVTLLLGEEYVEPGYSAKAEDGTDLTSDVKVSGAKFDRAGTFKIYYTATDSEGRATRLSRTVTIEPNTNYGSVGLPICMYHYVYDELDPPADVNSRYKNYISKQDLIEEMDWLNQEGYYYPTWEEVRDFIDGKLLLPDKSIVLTFDDGEKATLQQLVPIVEQTHVPVTSFLITVHSGEKKVKEYTSEYLEYESHTHDMHRAGGVAGYRGILPVIDYETGLADLKESIRICGSNKAFAYPYGDFNYNTHLMLEEAGFLCGVTTQYNKAYPGMDPLTLPRVRMWQDQTLDQFIRIVAPPAPVVE